MAQCQYGRSHLQLEPGEGAGHLPEPDVTGAARDEAPVEEGRECDIKDLLAEGLCAQDNLLLLPTPQSEHVIRV